MNNIYIDFKALKSDANSGPPFGAITKVSRELYSFPESIDFPDHRVLTYVKYTRAKKEKLLKNLQVLMARNALDISIKMAENVNYRITIGKLEVITEDICLGKKELSFK